MDNYLQDFLNGFMETAAFQATDEEVRTCDYLPWCDEACTLAEQWCIEFIKNNMRNMSSLPAIEAGRCFAYAANGHGAGFLDHMKKLPAWRKLSDDAKKYEYHVYVEPTTLELNFD